MPGIQIRNMGGIAPRLSPRLLPSNAATVAENCKLWSGEVHAFRTPRVDSAPLKQGFVESVYYIDGFWLSWNADIDVVRGFIPGDVSGRIYFTGDGNPKTTNVSLATTSQPYPTVTYDLGVAAPSNAPTLVLGAGGSGVPLFRSYVYTYVTAFGEEGPPSAPSALVSALNGQSVVVSGLLPPTSANVTRVRIYRTSTATVGTDYVFVAEIAANVASYNDVITVDLLGEKLLSQDWYAPPNNMIGLSAHPAGFLVGFVGNQLYLSEAFQPHAYPPAYVKVLESPIVAVGIYGNTIVVTTTGFPYLVTGSDPRNMTVEKLPDPYPCVSKRSLVSGDRGIIYASNEGLVWIGYGGTQVITRDVLSRDEWALYNPTTIHGVVYDGRYFGFYLSGAGQDFELFDPSGSGFVFDYNDRATGVEQRDKLTTLGFYATSVYANPDSNLYFVSRVSRTNILNEWEAGATLIPYTWTSKAFVMPYLTNFATAKVVLVSDVGTTQFSLLSRGIVKYSRVVKDSEPFRLPAFSRSVEPWKVQITGTRFVAEIHLGTSINELAEGKVT